MTWYWVYVYVSLQHSARSAKISSVALHIILLLKTMVVNIFIVCTKVVLQKHLNHCAAYHKILWLKRVLWLLSFTSTAN